MIGSSKRCTSVTKPIQLQSNLHGLNSLKLTTQVLHLQHLLHQRQRQQHPHRQHPHQKVEHHRFLKLHKKFLRQRLQCKQRLRQLHKPHLLYPQHLHPLHKHPFPLRQLRKLHRHPLHK